MLETQTSHTPHRLAYAKHVHLLCKFRKRIELIKSQSMRRFQLQTNWTIRSSSTSKRFLFELKNSRTQKKINFNAFQSWIKLLLVLTISNSVAIVCWTNINKIFCSYKLGRETLNRFRCVLLFWALFLQSSLKNFSEEKKELWSEVIGCGLKNGLTSLLTRSLSAPYFITFISNCLTCDFDFRTGT